jgi:hypothetical protein
VVTVAIDVRPEDAHKWIDAASPTHPSLIDTGHVVDEQFGFLNIPMALWIDETGTIVRPAEAATIEPSAFRDMEIPEGLPERLDRTLREVKTMPDQGEEYRAAIIDWAEKGADSRYALSPDEVVARSQPRSSDHAVAAANFELGEHAMRLHGKDAAIPFWREAHRLYPENWTYKRQAWTLVTTEEGQDNDLLQGPNEAYDGNWLDDFIAGGGGLHYSINPDL